MLAMDKDVTKRLLREAGIAVPRGVLLSDAAVLDGAVLDGAAVQALGVAVVVKPSRVGSTVGLTLVRDSQDLAALEAAVELARTFDREVLVEEFLPGRELTVGVVGAEALAVGEIRPGREIFDYETKYTPGLAQEIFPAPISPTLTAALRHEALAVHRVLKLRDFSRIDFRLDAAGTPRCLEANTLPGMTRTSLLPQSAAAFGIDFDALCRRMVSLAGERWP
jgi:D-alanine-D-alanine ligase